MESYTCTQCHETLPVDRFYVQRHSRSGKTYRTRACKKCRNRRDYLTMRSKPDRYAKHLERGKTRGKRRQRGRRERMITVLRRHGLLKESNDAT